MDFVTFIYVTLWCVQAFSISFSEGRYRSHQKRDTRHKSLKHILQEAKYRHVKDILQQASGTQSHRPTRTNLKKLLDDVETLSNVRQLGSLHRRKRCVGWWCGEDKATKGTTSTTTTPPPFAKSNSTTVKTEATTTVSSTTAATASSPLQSSSTATQSSSVASTSSSTATQSSSVASTSSDETQSNTSPTVTVTTDKTNGGSSVFVWSLTTFLVPLLLAVCHSVI